MTKDEIRKMNTTTLAYLGDAVFEVIVREKIVTEKPGDVGRAHHTAVRYVSAAGQAKAAGLRRLSVCAPFHGSRIAFLGRIGYDTP